MKKLSQCIETGGWKEGLEYVGRQGSVCKVIDEKNSSRIRNLRSKMIQENSGMDWKVSEMTGR